jgi:hypothetical protein
VAGTNARELAQPPRKRSAANEQRRQNMCSFASKRHAGGRELGLTRGLRVGG